MESAFSKVVGLEVSLQFNQKTTSSKEVFPHGFCKIDPFKISEEFLRDIFAKHFLIKLQASDQKVASLLKITFFTNVHKGDLDF